MGYVGCRSICFKYYWLLQTWRPCNNQNISFVTKHSYKRRKKSFVSNLLTHPLTFSFIFNCIIHFPRIPDLTWKYGVFSRCLAVAFLNFNFWIVSIRGILLFVNFTRTYTRHSHEKFDDLKVVVFRSMRKSVSWSRYEALLNNKYCAFIKMFQISSDKTHQWLRPRVEIQNRIKRCKFKSQEEEMWQNWLSLLFSALEIVLRVSDIEGGGHCSQLFSCHGPARITTNFGYDPCGKIILNEIIMW